ncbi:hypothetical protein BAL199_29410 [alpha proteobacterium BAL199]|nr:hypothetical protein BAL199_29410 [alpha proteobacterium BAL199]
MRTLDHSNHGIVGVVDQRAIEFQFRRAACLDWNDITNGERLASKTADP